ncbi:acetate--CoA ligase family protein [Naumannella huperziae]
MSLNDDEPASLYRALFRPESVAIVGASGRGVGVTARPLRFLRQHRFAGRIHPVNPRYDEIDGIPCFPDLASIPDGVDTVLSLVPAAQTAQIVQEAAAVGARVVVVFASGFAEVGEEGRRMQAELDAIARRTGVRIVGPNCQGLIHVRNQFFGTFTNAADREMHGTSGVAYVGQSGAVGGSMLDLAAEMGLSLTAWASTGNQANLDLVEVAEAMITDDQIKVVLMYAEGIADGARFVRLARRAAQAGKRLVLLRSGRSSTGKLAAASHTGAMLGDDLALVAAAERYGVILVGDVNELLSVGAALAAPAPLRGNRLGVITASGGAGILLTDHAEDNGLEVPPLGEGTTTQLAALVPAFGAVANPVDITAQAFSTPTAMQDLAEICRLTAADEAVDSVAFILTMVIGQRALDVAQMLAALARDGLDKPLWIVWLASREQTADARAVLREAGIPVFASVGDLARTLARVVPGPTRAVADVADDPEAAAALLADTPDRLDKIFSALAVDRASPVLAARGADVAAIVSGRPGPFAMKINAPSLTHKSDIGGVRLDVAPEQAETVFAELAAIADQHGIADFAGVDIEPMARPGLELIVGATSSGDGYPAIVSVGLGGTATEVLADVAATAAPIDAAQATDLLRRLKSWPLLDGFRGRPPADVAAVTHAVSAVSRMAAAASGHRFEFEINPLIVHAAGEGATAADVLVHTAPAPDGRDS